jgi:hypothetical protein
MNLPRRQFLHLAAGAVAAPAVARRAFADLFPPRYDRSRAFANGPGTAPIMASHSTIEVTPE